MFDNSAPDDDSSHLRAWNRRHDEAAFARFVQRHAGMVLGAARRKTGRAELAEEVAQAVFALAARRAAVLAEHPCVSAWLHRTTILESANALRREQKHRTLADAMARLPDTSPAVELPASVLPQLDDALNALHESDRCAVLLRYGEQLSYDEMAARLGKSADACQKQTSRALERLRSILAKRAAAVTAAALGAGLTAALTKQAGAAVSAKISAAAIAAAPKISFAAILQHIVHTMSTGKQIAAAAGVVALLASVPLGLSWSEAASLRNQIASRPHVAPAAVAAKILPAAPKPSREEPGNRILPGVSSEEGDRTVAMLRALRGRLLTSPQLFDISRQIMDLPASHMPKALEAMADFTGLLPAGLLRVMVFARWGELDPEAAMAAAMTATLDPMTAEMARHAMASGWLERDPGGLAAWLRDHGKSPMAGALAETIGTMSHLFDREMIQQLRDVEPPRLLRRQAGTGV